MVFAVGIFNFVGLKARQQDPVELVYRIYSIVVLRMHSAYLCIFQLNVTLQKRN